jgi:hypothetical protein
MTSMARQLEASIAIAVRNKAAAQLREANADVQRALRAVDMHRHGARSTVAEDVYRRALERFHALACTALNLGEDGR